MPVIAHMVAAVVRPRTSPLAPWMITPAPKPDAGHDPLDDAIGSGGEDLVTQRRQAGGRQRGCQTGTVR